MAKLLSNIRLLVGAAVLAVAISFATSFVTSKWHWFGRSGAVLTMAGVILSVRPLVRMGFSEWFRSLNVIDGGHFELTPEEIEAERQSRLDATASHVGVYMALVGTVVWAYGDLIGGFPQ
ncbi:MAG: hypothetical protein HYY98_00885 [Burkholderiales bacterium]|nr:hypothetical protein [Burkholderiales bacterium]